MNKEEMAALALAVVAVYSFATSTSVGFDMKSIVTIWLPVGVAAYVMFM